MDNYICKCKTLMTKMRDREYYWGAWRWYGKAKIKFFVNIFTDILDLVVLYFFAELIHLFLPEIQEGWYLFIRVVFWIVLVLAIVRAVFQGEFFVLRCQRSRKKMMGDTPAYIEIEFYNDHFLFRSDLYDRTERIPYADIIKYKETSHYCVLFLANDTRYVYGKEEFLQGSAAEAYALFSSTGKTGDGSLS